MTIMSGPGKNSTEKNKFSTAIWHMFYEVVNYRHGYELIWLCCELSAAPGQLFLLSYQYHIHKHYLMGVLTKRVLVIYRS